MPVRNGALRLQKDDFNFPIVSSPFLCGNVSVAPAYVASLFQLICYRRYCDSYHGFLNRGLLLPRKLLRQLFLVPELRSPLSLSISQSRLFSFMIYHRIYDKSNTTVPREEHDLLNLPEHLSSLLIFPEFVMLNPFCEVCCRSLFILFLLAIVLSVLRCVASNYLFHIFKLILFGMILPLESIMSFIWIIILCTKLLNL